MLRFNGEGPAGLIDRKAPGQTAKLDALQRQALADLVECGPIPAVDGVVRWRLMDLAGWVRSEYGVTVSPATMSQMLKAMGYVKLSARPHHHSQNEHTFEAFKKNFSDAIALVHATLPVGTRIEIWWQNEARVRQKNKITRRWARRGTRPSAPKDQRTKSTYIFGTICPARRNASAVVKRRPGPMGSCDDATLVMHIKRTIDGARFTGEGYRKTWARLRLAGIRTSPARTRRLMVAHGLLAPHRRGTRPGKQHDGTITTEAGDVMWDTDMT